MKNPYIRVLLSSLIVVALSIAFMGFILPGIGVDVNGDDPVRISWVAAGMSIVITAVEWLMFRKLVRKPLRKIGFGLDRQGMFFMVLALLFLAGIPFGFMEITGTEYAWNGKMYSGIASTIGIAASIVISYLFAAFQEELFNRSFVYACWKHLSDGRLMVFSSLLFMAMHVPVKGFSPIAVADWFVAGILFMYVYMKSGSVWVATFVHAGMNLMMTLVIGELSYSLLTLSNVPSDLSAILFLVLMYAGLFILTFAVYGGKGKLSQPTNVQV